MRDRQEMKQRNVNEESRTAESEPRLLGVGRAKVLHLIALSLERIPDGWRSNQRMNQGLGRMLAHVGQRGWTNCSLMRTGFDDDRSVQSAQPQVGEVAECVVDLNVETPRLWYDPEAVATLYCTDSLIRHPSFFGEDCRHVACSRAIEANVDWPRHVAARVVWKLIGEVHETSGCSNAIGTARWAGAMGRSSSARA
jgi:hypothetical protein